ncbi:hypothetical protein DICVIV_12429 [Dictyocaulus viviparus]|uniref:Uncharacterized protein n=1 Tax=Dictyocaulus viviparus TaxID=29172 RepID=A0A0D8XAJ2_DICVI|nr:hypothetical protein DICVIV_12429 [Dictyocaulus viviparus]
MNRQFFLILTFFALSAAQLCSLRCPLGLDTLCGGCGNFRAFRLFAQPQFIMPSYREFNFVQISSIHRLLDAFTCYFLQGPCGSSSCPQSSPLMSQQLCGGNICNRFRQQLAYGIPDPIITESGGVVRAPFMPPSALPIQPIQYQNIMNTKLIKK